MNGMLTILMVELQDEKEFKQCMAVPSWISSGIGTMRTITQERWLPSGTAKPIFMRVVTHATRTLTPQTCTGEGKSGDVRSMQKLFMIAATLGSYPAGAALITRHGISSLRGVMRQEAAKVKEGILTISSKYQTMQRSMISLYSADRSLELFQTS